MECITIIERRAIMLVRCPDCKGTGKYETWICQLCEGKKYIGSDVAKHTIQEQSGYKEMMKGFINVK